MYVQRGRGSGTLERMDRPTPLKRSSSVEQPQLALLDDGHAELLERDRLFEVDRTPAAVVRQGLEWAIELAGIPLGAPLIDVGAGAGVFGQQYNRVALERGAPERPRSVAIEPRGEEAEALQRHYDRVHVCTFAAFVELELAQRVRGTRDTAWCASNPAFSIFPSIVEQLAGELRTVLLYGSIAWGCSAEGSALFEKHPPFACARVVGRVAHRGPGLNPKDGKPWASDQRDVCWWLWVRGERPRRWTCENLPELDGALRRWRVPPGSELELDRSEGP